MKTAAQFYDFCLKHHACAPSLKAIKGKTAARWWKTTDRGDWMLWLREKGAWDWTPKQEAKYLRVEVPALAEYQRVMAPALAEYQRVEAAALAKYQRVEAPALAKYQRVRAAALRQIMGNPFKVKNSGAQR